MSMFTWWHHITTPHCPECISLEECKTCETLRSLLEQERFEKKELLNQLLDFTKPKIEIEIAKDETTKAVNPRFTPWRVKQQILETEDREKAKILKREGIKSVAEMEKELGIKEIGIKNA